MSFPSGFSRINLVLIASLAIAVAALFAIFTLVPGTSPFESRVYSGKDHVRLPYRLYVPPSYDKMKKYPLVIWLHGADAIGNDNLKQITGYNTAGTRVWMEKRYRERFPAIVVAPQSYERSWFLDLPGREALREEQLVFELIARLQTEWSIDADRIYLVGQSMGGMGTWAYLSHRPEVFAAGVVLCGPAYPKFASRIANIPVWVFHGAKDDNVYVDNARHMVELLRSAGGQPRYTEYPGLGHEIGPATFDNPDLLPWLFAQRRNPTR